MTPVDLKYISLKHHRRIQLDSISVKMQTSAFVPQHGRALSSTKRSVAPLLRHMEALCTVQ
jgi:hypothetical protein